MVYLDFADAVMDIDTRERATKVHGGATFVTGHNPVVVYPRKCIDDAPFHPGDRF